MNAIEIRNLTFSYDGKRRILDNINIDIEKGTVTGIVGDSGKGKSTLCHILCGVIPHAIGGALYGNVSIGLRNGERYLLRDLNLSDIAEIIGFVMQDSDRQIVSSTVEDELAFGPENMCVEPEDIRRRVDSVLKLLGIENIRYTNPNNLSGGQKRLVAIGSMLTMDQDIIIMDEPYSALDERGRDRVHSAIKLLREMGKTILIVEHDREMIKDVDRIICLNELTG